MKLRNLPYHNNTKTKSKEIENREKKDQRIEYLANRRSRKREQMKWKRENPQRT